MRKENAGRVLGIAIGGVVVVVGVLLGWQIGGLAGVLVALPFVALFDPSGAITWWFSLGAGVLGAALGAIPGMMLGRALASRVPD